MLFTSSIMPVLPEWIDYNGHLNMAYYNVLFDRAMDELFDRLGIGQAYLQAQGCSMFAAEAHVCYRRELHAGQDVRVTYRLIDADNKRLHTFAELYHAQEGWLSASCESLGVHIDMTTRKVAPFPADVRARIDEMLNEHRREPVPKAAGRRIGLSQT